MSLLGLSLPLMQPICVRGASETLMKNRSLFIREAEKYGKGYETCVMVKPCVGYETESVCMCANPEM